MSGIVPQKPLTLASVCGHVNGVENLNKPCSMCAGTGQVPITLSVRAVFDAARVLADGGQPITRQALANRTGCPPDTVYSAIRELHELGHLRRDMASNGVNNQYQYLLCTDADR